MGMNIKDALKFMCKYVRHPARIGAVCPSSSFLARRMAAAVGSVVEGDVIVELGAGTGAVTSKLCPLAAGGGAKLYCVEFDGALARILEERFPAAVIVNDSAENIEKILAGEDSKRVKAIVSCLPLVSLPGKVVSAILNASENALPKGGRFIQFTYNLVRSPESLGFKKMRHEKVSFVALNIPPARVDVFVKESQ